MNFEKDSIIYNKSYMLALKAINIYKDLYFNKKDYVLSKQFVRSSTSIGANISESFHSQSTRDNIAKLYISLKEAGESKYWLMLLKDSNIVNSKICDELLKDILEIEKILISIIKKNKSNLK